MEKTDESSEIGDFDENQRPSQDSNAEIICPSPNDIPPRNSSPTVRSPWKGAVDSPPSGPVRQSGTVKEVESPVRVIKHGVEEAFLNAKSKTESDVRLWNCYQARLPRDPASSLTVTLTSSETVCGVLYWAVAESATLLLTFPSFQELNIVSGSRVRVDPPWRERTLGSSPWRIITAIHYFHLLNSSSQETPVQKTTDDSHSPRASFCFS